MTHAVPPSVPFAWSAHPRSGWAFWWRWVLATNVGWFPGIVLGTWLAQPLAESTPTLAAVAAGAVAGLCFGATQAFALRATLPTPLAWWLATALGWPLGIGAARLLLDALGVIESDDVTLSVVDGNSSCLLREPGNDDCKYVVMPMRL